MKRADILVLVAWIVLPPPLLLLFHGNFFISSILYLLLPSFYFSLRNPEIIRKAIVVSLAAMPLMIIFDYMAFLNNAWTVETIFPYRVFQFIPFEDFFFTFLAVYTAITGFNHYFPSLYSQNVNKKQFSRSAIVIGGLLVAFILIRAFRPDWLLVPYYDAWLMLIAFIFPASILFVKYPHYRKPLLLLAFYELILFLPYEIIAGKLGFWTFPSEQYLGMIHLLGWSFPIEEFLEWMIFFAPAALSFSIFLTGFPASDRDA